jgi:hypothetical protein
MKLATYRIAGERRVGIVDERRKTVSAFDLSLAEAECGVLAVVGRFPLPPCLSPTPMSEAELQAPIPRPRRNVFCICKNLSRARQRVRLERLRFERVVWSHAKIPDRLLEGP